MQGQRGYICIFEYIHMYISTYIFTYVYVYVCIYTHIYVYIKAGKHVSFLGVPVTRYAALIMGTVLYWKLSYGSCMRCCAPAAFKGLAAMQSPHSLCKIKPGVERQGQWQTRPDTKTAISASDLVKRHKPTHFEP